MQPSTLELGRYYRNALIFTVLLLTSLGLLAIYSSSSIPAEMKFHDSFFFVRKQSFVAALGFAAMSLLQVTSLRVIERLTLPLLILSACFLLLTLVPSFQLKVNGASRWVRLAFFSFQPSELGKLAIILFLARNLSRTSARIDKRPIAILPNLGVLAGFACLLMLQPDFGSTVVYAGITIVMLFVAGLSYRYIASALACSLIGAAAAIIHAPYRLARITSFLDPWESIRTGGFQIVQSYLGFHNGGLLGAGLGESRQKLFFLPEAHTDFILSVIGEETGLLGVLLVLLCFAYIAWLGMQITNLQSDTYRKFLAMGLSTLISIQAIVNMGVAMGLLPTKGMPLPFVSYGSSSLLSFLLMVGILARLAKVPPIQAHLTHQAALR